MSTACCHSLSPLTCLVHAHLVDFGVLNLYALGEAALVEQLADVAEEHRGEEHAVRWWRGGDGHQVAGKQTPAGRAARRGRSGVKELVDIISCYETT
jgi:hypothetical protein